MGQALQGKLLDLQQFIRNQLVLMFLNNIVILSIQIKIKFKIPKNLNSKKDQRLNIF